jgi:hypothetical protein
MNIFSNDDDEDELTNHNRIQIPAYNNNNTNPPFHFPPPISGPSYIPSNQIYKPIYDDEDESEPESFIIVDDTKVRNGKRKKNSRQKILVIQDSASTSDDSPQKPPRSHSSFKVPNQIPMSPFPPSYRPTTPNLASFPEDFKQAAKNLVNVIRSIPDNNDRMKAIVVTNMMLWKILDSDEHVQAQNEPQTNFQQQTHPEIQKNLVKPQAIRPTSSSPPPPLDDNIVKPVLKKVKQEQ